VPSRASAPRRREARVSWSNACDADPNPVELGDLVANGKAERFIRTLRRLAYGAIYGSTAERAAALDGWMFTYNHRRRHAGIGRR
jgi:hypothetical protein